MSDVKPFKVVKGSLGPVDDLVSAAKGEGDVKGALLVLFVGEEMEPMTLWSDNLQHADLVYGARLLARDVEDFCFAPEEYEFG